jgi:hypothetical protein
MSEKNQDYCVKKNQDKLKIRCAGYYPYSFQNHCEAPPNLLVEQQTICFLPSLKTFQPSHHKDCKLQNAKKNCYLKYHYV